MKRTGWSPYILSVLLTLVFVSGVLAQDGKPPGEQKRVIEETLVLKDPTVAAANKWIIGGAAEYWYIKGKYDVYDSSGVKQASGDMTGGMPGGNIFFGYGDFTLNYAYRKGSFNGDFNYTNGCNTHDEQDQQEHEVTLRWLMRGISSAHVTPYLLAGYTQIKLDETETILNSFVWSYNGQKVKKTTSEYKAPLVGIGAILPFNEYFGLRMDGRVLWSKATKTYDNGYEYSGSGVGGSVVGTVYVNIWEGINLQVGGKFLALNGGDAGSYSKVGGFAMLGYSYKF